MPQNRLALVYCWGAECVDHVPLGFYRGAVRRLERFPIRCLQLEFLYLWKLKARCLSCLERVWQAEVPNARPPPNFAAPPSKRQR